MSITVKFVKGAHLSTYNSKDRKKNASTCDRHVIKVHQILRMTTANKPGYSNPTFDLRLGELASVRRVMITAPRNGGDPVRCGNDANTLRELVYDKPLDLPASLVTIEVRGGTFSYPHSPVQLPRFPHKTKTFGWIQVDFPTGPLSVDLFSAFNAPLGKYTVYDGQGFDIASYVMYELENNALDEEMLASAAGGSFKVLEGGDGQSGNGGHG